MPSSILTKPEDIVNYNKATIPNKDSVQSDQRANIPFPCDCINGEFLAHTFSYDVQTGDTYEKVAGYYANLTNVQWLMRFNSYGPNSIPDTGSLNVTVNCSCGNSDVDDYGLFITYPLRPGETLGTVANEMNLDSALLQRYNPGVNFNQGSGLNPESLWARLLESIYFPNHDFLTAKRGSHPSWMWSSILEGRDLIQRHGRWLVASGSQIKVGKHNWLASGGSLPHLIFREDLYVSDLMAGESRTWDPGKIRQLVPSEEAIKIMQTPIGWSLPNDRLLWPHTQSDCLFIPHRPKGILEGNLADTNSQKIKHFLWRASSNALAVLENLRRRRILPEGHCKICGSQSETVEHAFLLCPWVTPIWFGSSLQWNPNPNTANRFDTWLWGKMQFLKDRPTGKNQQITYLAFLLWNIWKQRNNSVFRDSLLNPQDVLQMTQIQVAEWLQHSSTPNNPALHTRAHLKFH
ncbi:Reverse transcriptase zinc-binding domain [Sesbania bispinosa]|nr:Reverse transcriptase zinc-binding domain [Sesbania bispinosa]